MDNSDQFSVARSSNSDMYAWAPPNISDDDDDKTNDGQDSDNEPQSTQQIFTVSSELKPIDLLILKRPEEQHRARYLSEGSRGAIKDRSGHSYVTVQLIGYNRPTSLEIFAASVIDPVKQHEFYRIIAVNGKNSGTPTTPCKQSTTVDGTPCIQVVLRPDNKMTAVLDCIGILKLCSHDLKRRAGKGKRDTSIRLALRATIIQQGPHMRQPKTITVQKLTDPISCVQQMGYPEVQKISCSSSTVRGGQELYIIGKNFDKNAIVIFREYNTEGRLVWNAEAEIDKPTLHQCHIVCSIPAFRDLSLSCHMEVTIVICCGNKTSHPIPFTYYPEAQLVQYVEKDSKVDASWLDQHATSSNALGWNQNLHANSLVAAVTAQGQNPQMMTESPNLESIIQMLEAPVNDNNTTDVTGWPLVKRSRSEISDPGSVELTNPTNVNIW